MRKKTIARLNWFLCVTMMIGIAAGTVPGICDEKSGLESVTLDQNAGYNGIVIPSDWKFHVDNTNGYRQTVPYLLSPEEGGYAPEIVNIDRGRQLFVDDFLVQETDLDYTYHTAKTRSEPVFKGDASWENTTAFLASGGVWYDMDQKLYKMWYAAGFAGTTAYATSRDGITWERPSTASDGSNLLLRSMKGIAGNCVWIDYNAPAEQRYKMLLRLTNKQAGEYGGGKLYVSKNGILWKEMTDEAGNAVETGPMGDRSTFYFDELNNQWAFSIRDFSATGWNDQYKWNGARVRLYHSGDSFYEASQWNDWKEEAKGNVPEFWLKTDGSDPIDTTQGNEIPQLYNVDAICYESITLGLQQLWYGPENHIISDSGWTKITEIQASYSRDGFYFDRPSRGLGKGCALIPASREKGSWDYGYVSTSGGGVIVDDDEIRIYYSAIASRYDGGDGMIQQSPYTGGSVSYATLRRDGFASLDGSGTVTTKPLTVTKDVRYLFVNANVPEGSIKAEILDLNGKILDGFSADDCVAFTGDSCCTMLTWKNGKSLSFLQGKGFRLRFLLENGEFYSFWLSADRGGASNGAVAAGYVGAKDLNPPADPEESESQTGNGSQNGSSGCGSTLSAMLPAAMVLPACALLHKRRKK